MTRKTMQSDTELDMRARAELALAYDPGQPPASLFRRPSFFAGAGVRSGIAALALLVVCSSAVLALRPPSLVREAIEHEYYERTLRGTFMEARPLLDHLGLSQHDAVPGLTQLMRPCDVDGHLAYHLTTFFEKGGMVTVFAFDKPVELNEGSGWWADVYWQVITSREGRPLVLVAQKRRALAVAKATFGKPNG